MIIRFYILVPLLFVHTLSAKENTQPDFTPKNSLIFIDGIKVVFRGPQGIDLITESEIHRPKLDGSPNSLSDMLTQVAFAQEARRYHMWPSVEDTDKQLRMVAQSNKLSPADLDNLFLNYGYTPAEGREAFAQMTAVNNLINFKITSNLFVPEKDVIAHYNENPEFQEASYYIQYAYVPFSPAQTKEQQLKSLQEIVRAKDSKHILEWTDPFWLKESELSQEKKFIASLQVHQISNPVEVAGGYGFYKLLQRKEGRLRSLDERYREIVDLLRRPKYSEMMNSYQKKLLDNASITEFNYEAKKGESHESKIKPESI